MNMWAKTRTALRRVPRQVVFALAITLTLVGLVPLDSVFAALSDTSPNPTDVSAGGIDGGVSHLIKKETVANVTTLRLGAYYPTGGGGGKELRIRYGISGKKCWIAGSIVSGGGNVNVTIEGQTTRTYHVPIARVCSDVGSTPRNNVQGTGSGWTNNKFFADYAFPNMNYDASVGKFYAKITIAYGSGVSTGGSDENSVNFRTTVTGDSGQGIIAPLENDFSNELGLRSAYFKEDPARNVVASTAFGLPCNETKTTFNVKLFDPDQGVFGETILRVTENGNVLPKSRYNVGNGVNVDAWDGSRNGFPANAPSNSFSSIQVNDADNSKNYRFVITNYVTPGKVRPNDNVLSVGIPYDSIQSQVACDYSLTPNIRFLGANKYSYYPNLTVNGYITKTGAGPIPEAHPWEIYAVRYSTLPNTNISGNTADPNPCNRAPAANRLGGCRRITPAGLSYSATSSSTITDTVGGPDAAGTQLCYFTRIRNPTHSTGDNNVWRYSDMVCAVAGVTPKLRVTGHDLKVGNLVDTSLSYQAPTAQSYGSWGEYGVYSNGTNTNMASGSGLLGGGPNSQLFWSALTFANNGVYGNYGGVLPPSYNPGTGTAIGNTLGATTFGEGEKRVLRYNGTLYITGNLTYDNDGADNNGYDSIKGIPEVKIVADNIIVAPTVTQIDPWLVALNSTGTYGRLSTCGTSPGVPTPGVAGFQAFSTSGLLNSGMCQNELKLNGYVVADQLYAYRTKDAPGDAWAENFDLRASNFLSAYAGVNTDRPVARTELITEQPPRF